MMENNLTTDNVNSNELELKAASVATAQAATTPVPTKKSFLSLGLKDMSFKEKIYAVLVAVLLVLGWSFIDPVSLLLGPSPCDLEIEILTHPPTSVPTSALTVKQISSLPLQQQKNYLAAQEYFDAFSQSATTPYVLERVYNPEYQVSFLALAAGRWGVINDDLANLAYYHDVAEGRELPAVIFYRKAQAEEITAAITRLIMTDVDPKCKITPVEAQDYEAEGNAYIIEYDGDILSALTAEEEAAHENDLQLFAVYEKLPQLCGEIGTTGSVIFYNPAESEEVFMAAAVWRGFNGVFFNTITLGDTRP
jgi:hypothetical protein